MTATKLESRNQHSRSRTHRSPFARAALPTVLAIVITVLASCPVNPLKQYLVMATGFEGEIHVSMETGDDANRGTAAEPLKTIRAAIELGETYLAEGLATTVSVKVAAGTYEQRGVDGVWVEMVEGISLLGGFPTDFSDYDPETYVTTIVDTSDGGAAPEDEGFIAAVVIGSDVTRDTQLNGFTIQGGSCDEGSANVVRVADGSPDIGFNVIEAGGTITALLVYDDDSDPAVANPNIHGNTIIGPAGNGEWVAALGVFDAQATIEGNEISIQGNADTADDCYAVYLDACSIDTFVNNTITGGAGVRSWGIRITSGSDITMSQNTITGGTGSESYAVRVGGTNAILSLNENTIVAGSATGTDAPVGLWVDTGPSVNTSNNTISAPVGVLATGTGTQLRMEGDHITSTSSGRDVCGVRMTNGVDPELYSITVESEATGTDKLAEGIAAANLDANGMFVVQGCEISASGPNGYYVGLGVADSPNAHFWHNTVRGGQAREGAAVRIADVENADIIWNTFYGGELDDFSTGIAFVRSAGSLRANIVHPGASAGNLQAMQFVDCLAPPHEVTLYNNTICGGAGDPAQFASAIILANSRVSVDNNIFFGTHTGDYWIIDENNAEGEGYVTSLRHNLFYHYPASGTMTLYEDADSTRESQGGTHMWTTISDLQDDPDGPGNETGVEAFGNLLFDGTDVAFVDMDGADDNVNTMVDNDWHLSETTPPSLYEGGYNHGFDAYDLDDVQRTDPWSIGAYEYDGP